MPKEPKATRRRLLPCGTLWGRCERREGLPSLRRFGRTTYLPFRLDGGPWGLYARDGSRLGEGREPAPGDALPEAEPAPAEPLLYIGRIAFHYGHFIVNTLPHLWPLVGWKGPRPRLLCHAPREGWTGFDFLPAVLARLGYGLDDLVTFEAPVRLGDVLVPDPALIEQAAVHPVFGDLCRAVGAGLWQPEAVDSEARPAYLAKTRLSAGITRLVNEAGIAEELERLGVEIVHPEALDFAAQVRLLSTRRIVLGTVGSAFHSSAFAAPGRRLVGLNWQPALNANFPLIDGLNGTRARYYHALGTGYPERGAFEVAWEVPDPRGLAHDLLRCAERLDRGEPEPGPRRGLDRLRGALRRLSAP